MYYDFITSLMCWRRQINDFFKCMRITSVIFQHFNTLLLILSAGGFRKFLLIRIISLSIVLFSFEKWKEYIYPLNFNKNRSKEKSPPNQISIQRILCKLWVQKKPYKKILVKIEFKTLFCQAQETFFQGNNSYLSTLWILFLAEITPSK